ncbi:MAG TPA: hypothetical protein VGF01_01110 [Terracidiphilus sp.]
MKYSAIAVCLALATLFAASAISQNEATQGQGTAVVTVLPKIDGTVPASVAGQDMSLKINGKPAKITSFKPFQNADNSIELVLLIDNSARGSLGTQLETIGSFVKKLPPNVKTAIAYMQNGQAIFAAPLSADYTQVLHALHLPAGSAGSSASPYFCLSDLAKHWPSQDQAARREVIMVSDGVDPYAMRYDPDNPYLQAAISDSVRARLVVYSLYWESRGSGSNGYYENMAGQSYLSDVTQATGGKCFWIGMGNPVSFEPYFDELIRRFRNQYELGFTTGLTGKPKIEELKLKFSAPDAEVDSPQKVIVYPAAVAQK